MAKDRSKPLTKVNLVEIIRQAADQVWGSDEREILYAWLERNTESEQMVEIDLTLALADQDRQT